MLPIMGVDRGPCRRLGKESSRNDADDGKCAVVPSLNS
jgi:hypothetical protein